MWLVSFLRSILYIAVIAALFVFFASFLQPSPRYRAETTIAIDTTGSEIAAPGTAAEDIVATQLQLLASPELARTVIQIMGLDEREAFASVAETVSPMSRLLSTLGLKRDSAGISAEERLVDVFAESLSLKAAEASEITIGFTAGESRLAADVANAVAAEYTALHRAAQDRDGLRVAQSKPARQRISLDAPTERWAAFRQQSGLPPVEVRILSRATAPIEPINAAIGPITWATATLSIICVIVLFFTRTRAWRRRKRRNTAFDLPEIVEAGPAVSQAHRCDDIGGPRIGRASATIAPSGTIDGFRDQIVTLTDALGREGAQRIMVATARDVAGNHRPLVAASLAREFARSDSRPLLIELSQDSADSRDLVEEAGLRGFADLFGGDVSFGEVIFRDRRSRAHFIPAGTRSLSRQELADDRIGILVQSLDHTYDQVIFDVDWEVVDVVGHTCDAAVIVTAFDKLDPRTASIVGSVRKGSPAKIFLFNPKIEESKSLAEFASGAAA